MKIRGGSKRGTQRSSLPMTPMIDIVFMLFVFFVMTFKIAAKEGEFGVKMPRSQREAGAERMLQLPIRVYLHADDDGALEHVEINGVQVANLDGLRTHIVSIVGDSAGGTDAPRVQLFCDYNLRYQIAMDALDAVSGYVEEGGRVVRLTDDIQLASPERADGIAN